MSKIQLSDGATLHYEQVGEGPDLVLIHGIGGNLATWHLKIVPMLWDQYQTLTYDLRGHGYSSMTDTGYTPTDAARDLLELMDQVGIEKADIVGHSFGGDVALYFAYLYPDRVRSIVIIEAAVPVLVPYWTEDKERAEWAVDLLGRLGIPIPADRRFDGEFVLNEAFKLPNKWGPLKDLPAQWTTEKMMKLYGKTSLLKDCAVVGALTKEAIPSIEAPTHLIYDTGSHGWTLSYKFLMENLPNVTGVMVPTEDDELPHFSPLEKPEVVVREILSALQAESTSSSAS